MIRSRAACWLLVGSSMTALFGCSTGTEHSVEKPSPGSIGIASPASPEVGSRSARVHGIDLSIPEVAPATIEVAPSTTVVEVPTTETPATEPPTTEAPAAALPIAEPETPAPVSNELSNELLAAPTTTTTAKPAVKPAAKPVVVGKAPTPTTAAPTPVGEPLTPAAAPAVTMDPAAASDISARTNGLRASVGLPGLARNGSLDAMAANWARELALSGSLRHSNSPNGAVSTGWSIAGENVGYGASSSVVHNALVGSAGHYANLVGDRYTNIGVGAARGADGRLWVCEVFAG